MRDDVNAVARWANLPLEERIAERLAAILFAADEIRDMVAVAELSPHTSAFLRASEQVRELVQPLLPPLARLTDISIERDPELEQMLLQLDGDLSRSHTTRGKERDAWWEQIEQDAAPYALAFYYEIRRLDSLLLARSFAPATLGLDSQ